MSDSLKNGKKDMDMDISLAMEKIVEETIGHIDVVAPTPINKKKKKRANKKANKKEKAVTPLPTKKEVTAPQDKGKEVKQEVQPKKEVQLFFPNAKSELKQPAESKQPEPSEAEGQKSPILRRFLIALLVLVVIGAVGTYGYFAYYYRDKFRPGTYINQIDCHGLTVAEAEALLRQRVEDYALEIDFREDKKFIITGEDISYEYVSDGNIEIILEGQRFLRWIAGYIKGDYMYEVPESITFDEAELRKQYEELETTKEENQENPEDAYVFYIHHNFEIIPEVEGTKIDDSVMYGAISNAIHASERSCSAEEAGAYIEPVVRSDDEKLAIEQEELNKLVNASVLYQLPKGEEVLDGNMLREWLERDEQGHYTKNDEVFESHIKAYVERLAEEVDTYGDDKEFKVTNGGIATVSSSGYGWRIDQKEEIAELKRNLEDKEVLEREPIYSSREFSTENNGFGDTYIEVNLTAQHLYVYEQGRLVLESDFVSGRMTRSRWTPPGIFTLTYKQKDKVLRSPVRPDGSYEYESPVSYWMPFNRGIGFHDATWRSSFGGTIYNYNGSHGCINMPFKKAQALYDIITKEIPIICFYTHDYKVRNG